MPKISNETTYAFTPEEIEEILKDYVTKNGVNLRDKKVTTRWDVQEGCAGYSPMEPSRPARLRKFEITIKE